MATTPDRDKKRDGVYFDTVYRCSNKIYQFFGISPASTPSSLSRLLSGVGGEGSNRSSGGSGRHTGTTASATHLISPTEVHDGDHDGGHENGHVVPPAAAAGAHTRDNGHVVVPISTAAENGHPVASHAVASRIRKGKAPPSTCSLMVDNGHAIGPTYGIRDDGHAIAPNGHASTPVTGVAWNNMKQQPNGHAFSPVNTPTVPTAAASHVSDAGGHGRQSWMRPEGLVSPRYFPSPRRTWTWSRGGRTGGGSGGGGLGYRFEEENDRRRQQQQQQRKVRKGGRKGVIKALVQDFGPIWFTWPINAGIIGLLLRLLPSRFQFRGLQALSTIAFLVSLSSFVLISSIFLLRLAWFRRRDVREIVGSGVVNAEDAETADAADLGYLACWPTAWLTLVAFAALVAAEENTDHAVYNFRAVGLAAYVAWWVGAAWVVFALIFALAGLFARPRPGLKTGEGRFAPSLALLICGFGLATLALVGGILVLRLGVPSGRREIPVVSLGLAGPVVVFSLFAAGAALLVSLAVYAVLLHELLLVTGWPPPEQTGAVFLCVGPLAQCAAALQFLGDAVNSMFGGISGESVIDGGEGGGDGVTVVPAFGLPLRIVCTLLAMLLAGAAAIWLFLAFVAVAYRAVRRELAWQQSWNGIVLSVAALALATLRFGVELDSGFFQVVTCVLLVFCVVVFLVNLGFTLWYGFRGSMADHKWY
ncbi:voltage-dependent anion channel-domain-containing protein [Podospora didyma]|uniref:Voltage-dependent anion channel-domain-containing protein n=1 Tax=Podospora didyma TaxID=330526 RepID=A0AAE0K587_9PEZI|nr:voltage-dependent anion channel-domain-containing protein [Podospora didyma]